MIGCYAGHTTDQSQEVERRHLSSSSNHVLNVKPALHRAIDSFIKKDIIYEPLESVSLKDEDGDEDDDDSEDDDTDTDDQKRDILLIPGGSDPATSMQQVMQVIGNSLANSEAQTPAASPLVPITLGGSRRGMKTFALKYRARPAIAAPVSSFPAAPVSSFPAAPVSSFPAAPVSSFPAVSPASLLSSSLRTRLSAPVYEDDLSESVDGERRMVDGMEATTLVEGATADNGRSDVDQNQNLGKNKITISKFVYNRLYNTTRGRKCQN